MIFAVLRNFMSSSRDTQEEMERTEMPLHGREAVGLQAGAVDAMGHAEDLTVAVLYERYLQDVFRYVWQRVPSIEDAEDITAEVFAAAAAGLPRFRGQCPANLWLLSIARRQIALAARRRKTRRETLSSQMDAGEPDASFWESLATADGPEAAAIRAEARRILNDLVAELSPDQREALMLQHMEGLTVAEIALVMGRSRAAVNSLLQRARSTIFRRGHAYFQGDDEEPIG